MSRYLITVRKVQTVIIEADNKSEALWLLDEPKIGREEDTTKVLGTRIVEIP